MLLVERGGDGPGHWTQLLALIGSPEEVRLPANGPFRRRSWFA